MHIKWLYIICLVLIMGAAFNVFYPQIENFFVFFPQSSFDLTPDDLHLNYRHVYLNTDDGERLHGWFFPLNKESPVILFCHGNAGNISHRLDNIRLLLGQKLQVFIFDYRGYGKSNGSPSEKGIYLDGIAAYDYLIQKEHISPKNIILFGRSLGAAVAIEVALKKNAGALIIESAFTSTKDMAKNMLLFKLLSPLLPPNYNNLRKIAHVNVPKLIIHGKADKLVPFSMGRRLFEASAPPKYFYRIQGSGHNDTYIIGGEKYFEIITDFIMNSKN